LGFEIGFGSFKEIPLIKDKLGRGQAAGKKTQIPFPNSKQSKAVSHCACRRTPYLNFQIPISKYNPKRCRAALATALKINP
jgi:hypothetical protein